MQMLQSSSSKFNLCKTKKRESQHFNTVSKVRKDDSTASYLDFYICFFSCILFSFSTPHSNGSRKRMCWYCGLHYSENTY